MICVFKLIVFKNLETFGITDNFFPICLFGLLIFSWNNSKDYEQE